MITYTHQLTPDERRARARERITGAARNGGVSPSSRYSREDLLWAFSEEELADLEQTAERVREEQRRRRSSAATSRQVRDMTRRVLAEWDAARRAEAEEEARRRLGLDEQED